MSTREVVRLQKNKSVNLGLLERVHIGVDTDEEEIFLVKMRDINKQGKPYIAIYRPESEEDLKLVEEHKITTKNQVG